jgi:hypothetical protein
VSLQTAAAELAEALISGFEAYCDEESDMSDPSTQPCTLGLYDLTSLDQLTGPIVKLAASLTQAFTSLESRDAQKLASEWHCVQTWSHMHVKHCWNLATDAGLMHCPPPAATSRVIPSTHTVATGHGKCSGSTQCCLPVCAWPLSIWAPRGLHA